MNDQKTVFEMAMEYYPRLWSKKRLRALVDSNKLTDYEMNKIIAAKEN